MAIRMQQRRGTAAQWTSGNPTLAAGEIGFETDTGKFKIGNGTSNWTALQYFTDANSILGGISGTDLPATLDTLNELAAAINDDPNFFNTIATNLSNHEADTTNVHGISNTAVLATQTDITNHNNDTTGVHGISDTSTLALVTDVSTAQTAAEGYADSAISVHNADTTQVHGIADTAALATKTYADDAVTTHNTDTTSVHGIADTTALVLNNDSRLSDTRTPTDNTVSTEKIVNSAVTADKIAGDAVTSAKIIDGAVTSGKIADGAIMNVDINASAAIAQSKIADLTTDLAAKAPLASPTFTGTVSGITKSMVGLSNVDNTSDADKPVSTATQAALDLKANLAGPTFTGTVVLPSTTSIGNVSATEIGYVDGVTSAIQTQLNAKAPTASPTFTGTLTAADATITGNLTVTGTTTTVGTTNLNVTDPMIYMGGGNTGNAVDLGIVSSFNDGTYQHSGIVRDASDGKWKLFKGVTDEPTTTVNFAQGSLDALAVGALEASSLTVGSVSNTEIGYLDGVTSAIQTQLDAKAPSSSPTLATPTITGALTLSASGVVFTDGTQTKEGVPSRTPIVQKTDSYTLSALTERDSLIEVNKATAATITIPTNATVAYPVGTSIDILQTGAGQVTIAGAGGVTVNGTPGLKLRTQWSSATLFKRATDTWVVMGDLSA